MNNNGQVMIFTLMVAFVVILLGLYLTPTIKQISGQARNESDSQLGGMNCTATDDDFVETACVIVDLYAPYFFGVLIGLAGLILIAKIVLEGV